MFDFVEDRWFVPDYFYFFTAFTGDFFGTDDGFFEGGRFLFMIPAVDFFHFWGAFVA